MAAELQAIYDGLDYGKRNLNGSMKILSDSIDAIHAIRNDLNYKGVEELLIKRLKV